LSINQDLYMGQAYDDIHSVYCYFGSGIILSGVRIFSFENLIRKILFLCVNRLFFEKFTMN